ncbi:MAG: VanW family protein [Actinobacteria bacterium]|nr:VanW family protein [Actinomycetota bacterium]
MRRPRPRLILGLGIPILIVVLLLAVWAIDSASASGKVPRNVSLAGRDIGKLPEDRLATTVADVAEHYADAEVQVRTTDGTFKVKAADLGLKLDQEATVQAALDLDQEKPIPRRPLAWASSFLAEREAPLEFTVDAAKLEAGLASLSGNAASAEPSLVATADAITVVSGSNGRRVKADGVAEQLLRRARTGEEPIVIDAEITDREPAVSDAEAQALADKLTAATAPGLAVTAGERTATIPPATVRSWVGSKIVDGQMQVTVDADKVQPALAAALPPSGTKRDAKVSLVNGQVQITPSQDAVSCCAPDSPDRVLATLAAGQSAVELEPIADKAAFTTEDAQKLGIKEPVGTTTEWKGQAQVKSFTTYYPCCAARVTNIHRIADLIRGTVVKPGETFSVNGVVGRRTVEKGFVEAGAIANGEHVDEVGGGVSQFATTMFNAAFFAGLPFGEYQAHSEHFDRYPYGREATMGYEHPDLQWKNNTPYGILIDTSYTATSVTVTLWSTQYAYGEQTGQSTGRSGSCTTVSTQRTIHYVDGRTDTDTVRARYRDPGVTRC